MEQVLVFSGAIRRTFVTTDAAPGLPLARLNVSDSLSYRDSSFK